MVQPPVERFRDLYHPMLSGVERRSPNMVNREFIREEDDFPLVRCTQLACDFLETNRTADNWFLQLELFDPHEPFTCPERFRQSLPTKYTGPVLDWPLYDRLDLAPSEIAELRANYLALVSMCDHYIGVLLDKIDAVGLSDNTAIVLTTDHGFLLGEKDWWGKNRMPMWDPIAHIPLIIAHPAFDENVTGSRCDDLTQCLDVPATLLDLFQVEAPPHFDGRSVLRALQQPGSVRSHALFGIFGGALNITDGSHVYMRYPGNPGGSPLFEYTLMPAHPQTFFAVEELADATMAPPFRFTQGLSLLKIPARDDARRPPMQGGALDEAETVLYNLRTDPTQARPVSDADITDLMINNMVRLMRASDAPAELYRRFDLPIQAST